MIAWEAAFPDLERLYRWLQPRSEAGSAACRACGRCCRFSEMDHILYATALEVAFFMSHHGMRPVPRTDVCPWQEGNHCTAREGRPLGCRVYFCAGMTPADEEALSTESHAELRAIHDRHALPWHYAPFLQLLAAPDMMRTR